MIDIDEISVEISQEQLEKLEKSYKANRLRHGIGNIAGYNRELAVATNLPVQFVNNWMKNKDAKSNPSNVKFNFNFKTMTTKSNFHNSLSQSGYL